MLTKAGDFITFTDSATFTKIFGAASLVNQFRFGRFNANGSTTDLGWLGYLIGNGNATTGRQLWERKVANTGAHAPGENRGFAPLVTLSLMTLLTVIAIGLLSLASISKRPSSSPSAQQQAQANARLAVMLALGDLQKNLGPDKRISARAETLGKDPHVTASVAPDTPEAWWVAVFFPAAFLSTS